MITKDAADLPARGEVADRSAILAELHTVYAGRAPELETLVDQVSTEFEFWPIFTLPLRHQLA